MLRILLACLILPLLFSCSLDYQAAMGEDSLSEDIPDMIMYGFDHVAFTNGTPAFRIYAAEALNYSKMKKTMLADVFFQEMDSEGKVITEGNAEKAVFYTDTEDAEFSGSIQAYSVKEETYISTDYLYWKDSERLLTGLKDSRVYLKRDSGTELEGVGFVGDLASKTFLFSQDVSGVYVLEEE